MGTHRATRRHPRSGAGIFLHFLGSMNLAITLLVAISIASVIGTIIPQAQPYTDYEAQFGPWWFEIFRRLGLYHVYSAGWYLGLLAFLVASVLFCLWRHTPAVIREMRQFRTHQQARSLSALRNHMEWFHASGTPDQCADKASRVLRSQGYRLRRKDKGQTVLLAAMRGGTNRLGYIFTHLAIVVICAGALIDGNLTLKLRELAGQIQPESRMLPLQDMHPSSRLSVNSGPFRGIVTIPEGERASVVFMTRGEGYLVRQLPFMLEVDAFRVEHYPSGEPRSFESDVRLHAPELDEPLTATIAVNQPLQYRGYTIYQSTFGDGGSTLFLRVWPLDGSGSSRRLEARVASPRELRVNGKTYHLEPDDFALHNIQNVPGIDSENRNLGPSFIFRLRSATGERREYENFMLPARIDGDTFFISGVRNSPSEPFRYLHMPADANGQPDTFLTVFRLLTGAQSRAAIAGESVEELLKEEGLDSGESELRHRLTRTGELLMQDLLSHGLTQAIRRLEERFKAAGMDSDQRELWLGLGEDILAGMVEGAQVQASKQTGAIWNEANDARERFLRHTLETLPAMERYGSPLYLQLEDFQHRQSTGLEVARSPGKPLVYLGFGLLVIGIVLMFYVPHRRAWCLLQPEPMGGSRILLACSSQRDPVGGREAFRRLADVMRAALPADNGQTE